MTEPAEIDPETAEQVAIGERLYAEHCASCHGAELEGQPNWKTPLPDGRYPAPPHDATGHTRHHDDAYLFETTKHGGQAGAGRGFVSGMPASTTGAEDRDLSRGSRHSTARRVCVGGRHPWPRTTVVQGGPRGAQNPGEDPVMEFHILSFEGPDAYPRTARSSALCCAWPRNALATDRRAGASSEPRSAFGMAATKQGVAMKSVVAEASSEVARTRRLYRRVAPLYDGFRLLWSRWTRPAENALDALFRERIAPGSRILELAPGTGINVERLLRWAPDFASYLGIDASEEMLARAREKARGDARIELRIGDATDLRGVEGRFDFLVCTWLLSHLDAPADAVRDALSKLSPGGTVVFVFFTQPTNALFRRVLERLGGPLRYRFVDAGTIRTLPDLERIESCAGGTATLAVFRTPAASN